MLFLEILQYAECVVNMLIYWCYIYIIMNGCKLYVFDIIIHGTWHKVRVINCSRWCSLYM